MISMFTSDSQHPPRSRHAVHLGDDSNFNIDVFYSILEMLLITHAEDDIQVWLLRQFVSKCNINDQTSGYIFK